ncbi:phenylalanine--tRNA ligase subunit beta [Candidatus Peregrinibacteria bacterium]|nr:phenylalanine--tRNA ligase subunit beta [Candidatus Peregrinibacteria bacterium]
MKISLDWLSDYIDITEKNNEKIKEVITTNSAEVETMEKQGDHLDNIVVGKVVDVSKHPNADSLIIAKVNDGNEDIQVVCGGSNVKEGMLVAFAKIGAIVKWHGSEVVKMEKAKIRGEESFGMICASEEIGLEEMFPKKSEKEIVDLSSLDLKVGAPLANALGLGDVVLDIDNHAITNRSDLFSHRGFAREFVANGLGKWRNAEKTISKSVSEELPKSTSPSPIKITIKDKDVCSRYMGVYLTDVEVKDSPDWMKKRLISCGVNPINNIVDTTNYVMLELGMPLHAFDVERVKDKKWTMRKSKKGEKIVTLDKQEHELFDDVIVLDDGHELIDLCGIMGGYTSGIEMSSNKIWLISPVYNPTLIRSGGRGLGHISDASVIYEKGVDAELASDGLYKAIELILHLCPNAKVASEVVDIRNEKPEKREINLVSSQINRLIGIDIEPTKVEKILKDLGFENSKTEDGFLVQIPSFRLGDVHRQADLIEEIARIYGYDNIPLSTPVTDITPVPANQKRELQKRIKNDLISFGFNEIYTYAFLGPEILSKCNMEADEETIEIMNPISGDMSLMRQSLLPRVLETISENRRFRNKFRVFELNPTYFKTGNNEHEERSSLLAATVNEDFRVLQGVMEEVGFKVMPAQQNSPQHHPGREADLVIRGQVVGQIAEVHPQILKNFDIKARVTAASIDLEAIYALNLDKWPKYKEFSKFPTIQLDISIAVPRKSFAADYFKVIQGVDKKLISNIELIDEYKGEKIEKDKRALTYSVTYQASDRTLTDEEVNIVHQEVLKKLRSSGAEVR